MLILDPLDHGLIDSMKAQSMLRWRSWRLAMRDC